jgi:hypothetical protein
MQRRCIHASAKIEGLCFLPSSCREIILQTIGDTVQYACPTWVFAADTQLMKLQRLQNRVLRDTGKLDRRTPVRDFHLAFKIPYVYDYITKLCRRQAEVILNHENPNVRATGQGEARHRKHKRFKLGGGQVYSRSSVWLPFLRVK